MFHKTLYLIFIFSMSNIATSLCATTCQKKDSTYNKTKKDTCKIRVSPIVAFGTLRDEWMPFSFRNEKRIFSLSYLGGIEIGFLKKNMEIEVSVLYGKKQIKSYDNPRPSWFWDYELNNFIDTPNSKYIQIFEQKPLIGAIAVNRLFKLDKEGRLMFKAGLSAWVYSANSWKVKILNKENQETYVYEGLNNVNGTPVFQNHSSFRNPLLNRVRIDYNIKLGINYRFNYKFGIGIQFIMKCFAYKSNDYYHYYFRDSGYRDYYQFATISFNYTLRR